MICTEKTKVLLQDCSASDVSERLTLEDSGSRQASRAPQTATENSFEALDVRKHGQFLPLQSSQSTAREKP